MTLENCSSISNVGCGMENKCEVTSKVTDNVTRGQSYKDCVNLR